MVGVPSLVAIGNGAILNGLLSIESSIFGIDFSEIVSAWCKKTTVLACYKVLASISVLH